MQEESADKYAQRALDLNLLSQRQLDAIWADLGTRSVTASDFRSILLRKELLTNYQVERLIKGERTGFFYGNYKVQYLVGKGTFARVYRAVAVDNPERVVAIKVLRNQFGDDRNEANRKVMDQFLREGETGMSLRHPNIVPIYEVYSRTKPYFLVMEFIEGNTLRDFMKLRRRLSPLEATELMSGIMSGLACAAQKGLYHRDLKLSNVLISSSGEPKLVDFGLAAEAGGTDEDSVTDRTIDYAGLERASGARRDGPRSDIYFAGCMYYHMLSGKAPLQETKDRIQRLSKTRFQDIPPISTICDDIPQRLAYIVMKSMEFDPERRYQTATDMLTELHSAAKSLREGRIDEATDEATNSVANANIDTIPRTVLVVESAVDLQNTFRAQLKKYGFRVLVMSDAQRALDRFGGDGPEPDCVVF
ncbi:MAG: protein kinase, partial [Planctomycetota bacterium]|nr:protein kinase [Planctomycetota bacterium]